MKPAIPRAVGAAPAMWSPADQTHVVAGSIVERLPIEADEQFEARLMNIVELGEGYRIRIAVIRGSAFHISDARKPTRAS